MVFSFMYSDLAVGWVAGTGHLGFRRAGGGGCLIGPHWSQVKRAGSSIVESLVRLLMEGTRSVYS